MGSTRGPDTRPGTPGGRRATGTFARVRTSVSSSALIRTATAVALLGALNAGCGLVEDDPAAATPGTSQPAAPVTPTPVTVDDGNLLTPSPSPTEPPSGSGDSEDDDAPATAGGGICGDLEATAVGQVLGATVTGAGLQPRGCEFKQRTSTAPATTFVENSFAGTAGGMDGAKSNATASVEGEPKDLTGIGTAAFVVTGTTFGGEDVQGAGAVRVGDRLIEITLSQRDGLSASQVRALVVGLLKLVAEQAS